LILVDTNVLSETSRLRPDPNVLLWLATHRQRLWMPTIALAELRYGVEKLPASRQREELDQWLAKLTVDFAARMAPFDRKAAESHGRLRARLKLIGKPMDAPDSYIAAIARSLRVPVATRNMDDFEHAEIELLDPWRA